MKKLAYFPTLIFRFKVPSAKALNAKLLSLIYAERERDKSGIQRSNFPQLGGWHSRNDLHKYAEYGEFIETVDTAAELISAELGYDPSYPLQIGTMWSIINPPGSSNLAHIHPGCTWSGVYYVQAPEASGKISFTDPRTQNLMQKPNYIAKQKRSRQCWTKVHFEPVAGRMLIFPSWLYHSVNPNLSNQQGAFGQRVIMSFNLRQKKTRTKRTKTSAS